MVVKSHKMFRDASGELHDTPDDDDPDSPEVQFAADMTAHYDELGQHFPMFARLKELSKLQFLGKFLNGIEESMKQKAEGKVSDETLRHIQQQIWQDKRRQIANMFSSMRRDVGVWPAATDYSTVQGLVREHRATIKSKSNISSWDHSQDDYIDSMIEPKVVEALRERDNNYVSQIVDALFDVCQRKISRQNLNTMVRNWLANYTNAQRELEEQVWSCLRLPTREDIRQSIIQHYTSIYNAFRRMHTNLRASAKQNVSKLQSGPACDWVPAALYTHEEENATYLSYGGVMLQPRLREGPVTPPTRAFDREKITPTSSQASKQRANTKPPESDYRAPKKPSIPILSQMKSSTSTRRPQTKWASLLPQKSPPGRSDTLTDMHTTIEESRVTLANILNRTQSRTTKQGFWSVLWQGGASREGKGGGGEGGGKGGGGGDDGDGRGDGDNKRWQFIMTLLVLYGAHESFSPTSLRDHYKARKFRKEYQEKNPSKDISDKHAAHLFSLSLLSEITQHAFWHGKIPTQLEEARKALKDFANRNENFSMVPRRVNLSDHRKMDNQIQKAIDDRGKTRLNDKARERAQEQLDYAKTYAAEHNIPWLLPLLEEAYMPLLQ